MRLIDNKVNKVEDEMYDISFKNHLLWCSNLSIYSNQDILSYALITSGSLLTRINDEINRQ